MGRYEQRRDGNSNAFEKLMVSHCAQIELFAIQYGCMRRQAAEITEEAFRQIYADLENFTDDNERKFSLYRIALEKLTQLHRTGSEEEPILPFEEDQQLHELILHLDEEAKLSFILSRFHKMNDGEIATVLGIPEETVKGYITQAVQQLTPGIGSPLLDKRLEFLEKSYERISLSFRQDQVFALQKQKPAEKKKRNPKNILLTWIAGLLALAAMVIVTIVNGEAYQKASGEKYIEQLKASFEEEIASRYTRLGLKESTEEDHQNYYYFTAYGKQAREDFERRIEHEAFSLAETGRLHKKKLKKQYDEIIRQLALPSEMVEQLINQPLTSDKEKSAKFISEYMKQMNDIQESYITFTSQHQLLIEEAKVEGTVQIEKFLGNKESYPEELQQALNRMEEQNLYLTSVPQWDSVVPAFSRNELSAQMKASIHPDLVGYITHLESSTYISLPDSDRSYEEKMHDLLEFEHTLLANDEIELPYMSLRDYYSYFFNGMITESEMNRIIGPDGKITEEVQTAWKKIASGGEKSPSAHVMGNIIREMEASGWTHSETQSRFTDYHLNYAMGLTKAGKLDTFEMQGILQPDQGFDIVAFPDPSFEQLVEDTYRLYKANYDQAVLQDVHPFVIFGMYYLANEHDDPVTMWHLYIPEDNPQPLETYLIDWKREDFHLDKVDGLLFEGRESSVGSMAWIKGNMAHFYIELEADDKTVWKITSIYRDTGTFEE